MRRLILSILLLVLVGCQRHMHYAAGKEDEVFVVADPGTWRAVEERLRESLEREILIVHHEQIFHLIWTDPDEFTRRSARKNLLIVGQMSGQRSSKLIQEILPPSSLESAVEKGAGVFVIENLYREGQTVIVVVGTNSEIIRKTLEKSSDVIFQTLRDRTKERIKSRMFSNLNSRLVKNMEKKYGWLLKLPSQYKLTREEGSFVRFARHYPDRLIAVYWEDGEELEGRECLEKREWFGRVFYDGDTILEDMTKVRNVEVDGRRATRIVGVWQNEGYVMGGAFITYCIHDPELGRNYIIDGLVFSPGRDKWVYLTELEGIVESFHLE